MDTSLLRLGSQRLDESADLLRACAVRLAAHAGQTRWQSPAARAFADRLDSVVRGLHARAGDLDELADRFRARATHLELLP